MDIWGVGKLIAEASIFVFNISHELLDIGRRMRDEKLSTDDALTAVENYASKVF